MKNKNYLIFFTLFIFINGCQAIKDGLEGNKRSKSAEEFLINQKSPLILPPDFKSLPKPTSAKNDNIEKNNEEFDINKVIGDANRNENKNTKLKDNSLEESIIKIIKKN
tara:strand:+ start:687 stop:1013 length:327 start_codon:yes stop_codon:yes gene_type:complete